MTTTFTPGETTPAGSTAQDRGTEDPFAASVEDAAEGQVYTVTGQDGDSIVSEQAERGDERIVVNMGPQHPSTHGVLRIVLRTDGEMVLEAVPHLGYLHRCKEKIAESAVMGTFVEAWCGEKFPVTKSPKPGSPVCPQCKEIYEAMKH